MDFFFSVLQISFMEIGKIQSFYPKPSMESLAIETWYNMCYLNGLWSMKFLKFEPFKVLLDFPPGLTPCTTSSSYCFVGRALSPLWEVFVGSYIKRIPMHWRRKWQPIPVLLPRKSHGWRSLVSMGSQRVRHDWATSLCIANYSAK